jgi:uncharacterized protein YbjT (DUF2867 family)
LNALSTWFTPWARSRTSPLGSKQDFARQDRDAARNFARAAREAGVRRIVYLGGLGDASEELSSHLKSRQETGEALRSEGVPVIEFRASIILGSGSLSYELIRALVERLPIMVCPSWVRMKAQPIHIQDVVGYLMAALDLSESGNRVFEIGGEDQVSYADIMKEYAWQRGLRRLMIPVPLLTPYLSSLWLGLTTPVYARVGRKLVRSIRNATVVRNDEALRVFGLRPVGMAEAIRRAMRNEDSRFAATRWSDALSAGGSPGSWGGVKFGTRLVDTRTVRIETSAQEAFAPIRRIGGAAGWYYANWLWRVRGWLDLLMGGVGLRRGRTQPSTADGRGNEVAGKGVAGVPSRRKGRWIGHSSKCGFRSDRCCGTGVLVRHLRGSSPGFRWNAAGHRIAGNSSLTGCDRASSGSPSC